MKIARLNDAVLDIKGQPIATKQRVNEETGEVEVLEDLLVCDALITVCMTATEDDKKLSAKESMELSELARRVYEAAKSLKPLELSVSEASKLQTRVHKVFVNRHVAAFLHNLLEGAKGAEDGGSKQQADEAGDQLED